MNLASVVISSMTVLAACAGDTEDQQADPATTAPAQGEAASAEVCGGSAASGRPAQVGVPRVTDWGGLGRGGKYTLEPGSTDRAGVIEIDTAASGNAGLGGVGVALSAPLPGTDPIVLLTLMGGKSNWSSGATVQHASLGGPRNENFYAVWSNAGSNLASSTTFRIGYLVVPK